MTTVVQGAFPRVIVVTSVKVIPASDVLKFTDKSEFVKVKADNIGVLAASVTYSQLPVQTDKISFTIT